MHRETREVFYLANGKDLIGLLIDLHMIGMYPKAHAYAIADEELNKKVPTNLSAQQREE